MAPQLPQQEQLAARSALARIRIVLVDAQGAANIGAAARAMKNMGLHELALVGTSRRRVAAAARTAVHAADILERCTRPATLPEAVGDCALVVATSARGGSYRDQPEDPDSLAKQMIARAAIEPVALVFGPEHHGLTREHLRYCQRLVRIPADDAYPSLNLAQAVLLCCYALRRAALRSVTPAEEAAAPARDVHRAMDSLQEALLALGFLNAQNPDPAFFAIRRMLGRAVLRPHEVRLLLSLARRIAWAASAARTTPRESE